MKKKIVAMMLVGVIVVMNNAVAFGAISPGADANEDIAGAMGDVSERNVSVKYYDADSTVYSINIEWGDMKFTANPGKWDPDTHTYKKSKIDGSDISRVNWSANTTSVSDRIKVTNHSNAQVKVTVAFDKDHVVSPDTLDNLGAAFTEAFSDVANNDYTRTSDTECILKTGEGRLPDDASSVTKQLALESTIPNKLLNTFSAVGKVTVTLATP